MTRKVIKAVANSHFKQDKSENIHVENGGKFDVDAQVLFHYSWCLLYFASRWSYEVMHEVHHSLCCTTFTYQ